MRQLTEAQWEKEFVSRENPNTGSMYWEYADIQALKVRGEQVWSVVDGDGDSMFLVNGYHVVNVFGFMVTEKDWTPDTEVTLD